MTEWRKVKFLEVVQLNPRVSLTKGELYPFVEMSNAPIGSRYPENDVFQTFTGGGSKFEKRDTVIARIEPCLQNGKGFLSKYDKGFGSTEFLVFRPVNEEVMSYDFLYYFMGQQTIRDAMAKTMVGASGRQRVNNAFFNDLFITLPSLPVQRRIAEVLSRYDALIENYQRQIKLLEEAAQRLYKEWFVDLRFPGHQFTPIINNLPQSWQKKTVEECLIFHGNGGWGKDSPTGKYEHPGKVIRGTDIEDIKTGRYSDLPLRFHTDNDIKKRTLKNNDLVFELSNGNINNIGRCLLIDDIILNNTGDNTICASFCKLLRPIDRFHALMLYWEIQDMQTSGRMLPLKKQGANGINNFDFDGFLNHVLLIPADESLISPLEVITKKIGRTLGEIALLSEARDRLLPKLMSAEIEV